jgi:hypothetical protein
MKINEETLKTVYTRAHEYATVKYGKKPDGIELSCDGMLRVIYRTYYCGDIEVDEYDIPLESLTEDLDKVAAERMEAEEAARKERKERQERERIQREEM